MASLVTSRELLALDKALAKTWPNKECCSKRLIVSLVTPPLANQACTSGNKFLGATASSRKAKKRSPMIASATTDAIRSGQIGHPAATIICHTVQLLKIKRL